MRTFFFILFMALFIAGVSWYGYRHVNKPSDDEILRDAILDYQQDQRDQAARAGELSKKVLSAPASCEGLTTGFVYAYCETEPDPGEDWEDWRQMFNMAQGTCVMDAFHQTNAHAFEIQGKPYNPVDPGVNRVARFVSDLCGASLWTDGVDWGDEDASLTTLINGYYADRATSIFKPGHDY